MHVGGARAARRPWGTLFEWNDGTGELVVHCPAKTRIGPSIRGWFEFDVTLPVGARVPPVDPDTVANDESDPDRQFELKFVARYAAPANVIASAVRRAAEPE